MLLSLLLSGETPNMPLFVFVPVERAVPAAEEQVMKLLGRIGSSHTITGKEENPRASLPIFPSLAAK